MKQITVVPLLWTIAIGMTAEQSLGQTGACCEANGVCSQTSAHICSLAGGAYSGDGTDCDTVDCFGACCLADGTCDGLTEIVCTVDQGGTFAGGGTACKQGPCPGPVPSLFVYQGQLKLDGVPVTGAVDMQFSLWDARTGNVQIGETLIYDGQDMNPLPVQANNGLFQVMLDFGLDAFDGGARWLEVAVRYPAGSGEAYEVLGDRQLIAAAPYAMQTRGLFVDEDLDVGIRTTTPDAHLEIASEGFEQTFVIRKDGNRVFEVLGGTTYIGERDEIAALGIAASITPATQEKHVTLTYAVSNGSNSRMRLYNNRIGVVGSLGVDTEDPDFTLHANGSAGKPGGGSWSVASDLRLKKNVQPLEGCLDRLLSLRGVSYEYRDPAAIKERSGVRIGMVAQEVEQVFPDWVDESLKGYKTLTFRGFEALTVEALRELKDEQDSHADALNGEIESLRTRIAELETLVRQLQGNGRNE